jgi:hypothetical protein
MLRKRKEPKARKSNLETLMRDMQGTAAQKFALMFLEDDGQPEGAFRDGKSLIGCR